VEPEEESTISIQEPEAIQEDETPVVIASETSRAQELAAGMSLQEKICQMLFVTQEALTGFTTVTQSGDTTRSALEEYPVGGIIYFGSNLKTADQTRTMIENIQTFAQERSGFGLFIGVDEEGGTVARLADNLGTTAFDDMAVYGAEGDTQKAYEIGITLAGELKNLGFNVDFAPVADVLTNQENTVVQYRSFGADPVLVSDMVSQEVRGFVESGILCAPKHFPGHGSTGGDTHDGYAATDRTLEELEACDLLPFQAAMEAGAPMIMVGHMTLTAIDEDNPASLSQAVVTGLLRDQMGYNGIIITDALNMGAIANNCTAGEAAVRAIQAGCDMLLCVSDIQAAVDAVLQAVEDGTISESRINDSVVRILSAKLEYGIAS
jgi:beta-N-acetylhexosaminidase